MWWSCETGEQFRCWNLREPIAQLRRSSHLKNPDVTPRWTNERFRCERIDRARQYVGIGVGWDSVTKVEKMWPGNLRLSEYAQGRSSRLLDQFANSTAGSRLPRNGDGWFNRLIALIQRVAEIDPHDVCARTLHQRSSEVPTPEVDARGGFVLGHRLSNTCASAAELPLVVARAQGSRPRESNSWMADAPASSWYCRNVPQMSQCARARGSTCRDQDNISALVCTWSRLGRPSTK